MVSELLNPGERFFTKKDSDKLLIRIARGLALDEFKPNVIAAISRGGLVIGVQFSHYYATELLVLSIDANKQVRLNIAFHDIVSALRAGQKVLLVDEICDKGHTLHNICGLLQRFSSSALFEENFRTAVLVHNEGEDLFYPDYVGEVINKYDDPRWIVFDWEAWW
jgi:hypoxanthine phosphoribosyltransferase